MVEFYINSINISQIESSDTSKSNITYINLKIFGMKKVYYIALYFLWV